MRLTQQARSQLIDRRAESQHLDQVVSAARAGTSAALVVRGDSGVGKTALLDELLARSSGCRIVRALGVESEMELPFAGLHQLCAPFLERLDRLPAPQRDALGTAFGLQTGAPPDRFLVGLAVLSLLSGAARTQPLICLIDDAQWLDRASAQVIGFVARRLAQEAVVLLIVVRDPWDGVDFNGIAELSVEPLRDADARDLLASALPTKVDDLVRERILAESHGNPLALLELPRAWTPAAFAGGFALPAGMPVSARIEESFRRRFAPLPADSRQLLLLAAADPVGDPQIVFAAADRVGVSADAASSAAVAGLLDDDTTLRFRHPLVRSVVYAEASPAARRDAHRALAEVTDPGSDPDRRVWHLAMAASAPDEGVAGELERSAGRAQARGGVAAAAAFLGRAVSLTADPAHRAERALGAAGASLQAGAFDGISSLLDVAAEASSNEFQQARVDLLRAHVATASFDPTGPGLLLKAARQLEPFSLDLARQTYLVAWGGAILAGQEEVGLEVCRAAGALPVSGTPGPLELLVAGVARLTLDGPRAAVPTLKRAADAGLDLPLEDVMSWGWAAIAASHAVWDSELLERTLKRHVGLLRDAGALARLPILLSALGVATADTGDFAGAAIHIAEGRTAAAATGIPLAPYPSLRIAALRGREVDARHVIAAAEEAASAGQGLALRQAQSAAAVLYNGLGRYDEAASAATHAAASRLDHPSAMAALPELIEGAARAGDVDAARQASEQLAEMTQPCGTDYPLGIEARCRALLESGEAADALYREAVNRLARTRMRPDLGRAHLLYGEWLRREGRRVDAREHLREAHELFVAIAMDAFADRSARELAATGETVRRRSVETADALTPQELQIARLAGEGRTNPEIASQLFLSPRTVEWHLRKVYGKLEVDSRRQLRSALARLPAAVAMQ